MASSEAAAGAREVRRSSASAATMLMKEIVCEAASYDAKMSGLSRCARPPNFARPPRQHSQTTASASPVKAYVFRTDAKTPASLLSLIL